MSVNFRFLLLDGVRPFLHKNNIKMIMLISFLLAKTADQLITVIMLNKDSILDSGYQTSSFSSDFLHDTNLYLSGLGTATGRHRLGSFVSTYLQK